MSETTPAPMPMVNLGPTGVRISPICFGMMTYGNKKWREWVLPEDEARPFVQRAIEAGINFFDTADVYSLGDSEIITGRLLREFQPRREDLGFRIDQSVQVRYDPRNPGNSIIVSETRTGLWLHPNERRN